MTDLDVRLNRIKTLERIIDMRNYMGASTRQTRAIYKVYGWTFGANALYRNYMLVPRQLSKSM